jgi:hypothetical protein
MLTHNFTDTTWFHEAAHATQAICFTRGRVRFYKADGSIAAPTQGQAFFYFGEKVQSFVSVFSEIGFVVQVRDGNHARHRDGAALPASEMPKKP